jgi:hypothetical protein
MSSVISSVTSATGALATGEAIGVPGVATGVALSVTVSGTSFMISSDPCSMA